jgi:hypothetical protein
LNAKVLEKYLRRSGVNNRLGADFLCAVVIPACDELEELPHTLDTLEAALERAPRPVAVIVVVNHPEGAPEQPSLDTLKYLETRKFPNLYTLYVPGITGGVGRARKLGMDAFVAAHDAETLDDTLIWSLDADTRVERDYFETVEAGFAAHPEAGFCTLNFRHEPGATPELERAIREYEAYLREYVADLRRAGSPYAFFSIGSSFAVRGAAYVRAGGMKVRSAGEDFYFLQECAKCEKFFELEEVLTHPSARLSGRNVFGTGPALRKLLAGEDLNRIAPAACDALKLLLDAAKNPKNLASPENLLAATPPAVGEFLRAARFMENWARILANTPAEPAARERAFHRWFDGLKTLRLLHALSECP